MCLLIIIILSVACLFNEEYPSVLLFTLCIYESLVCTFSFLMPLVRDILQRICLNGIGSVV
jgi:hypothetical protein